MDMLWKGLIRLSLREDINRKKNIFFRALPESPKPSPPDPNLGNLVLFFGRKKRRFARVTEIVLNDDNDGFNDNYDDNFDDNYDKSDKKTNNYCEV